MPAIAAPPGDPEKVMKRMARVRFMECTRLKFVDAQGEEVEDEHISPDAAGYVQPVPHPESAEKLKTREIERADGTTETRAPWVYLFRLEETSAGRSAYVQEFTFDENGERPGDGRVTVEGRGPDKDPDHFAWLSSIQLSSAQKEAFRRDLQANGRASFVARFTTPLALDGTDDEYGRSSANYVRQREEGGFDVYLVDPLLVAETLNEQYQSALDKYLAWMSKAAPVKQMATMVRKLSYANDGVESELRMTRGGKRTEARQWELDYIVRQKELWRRGDEAGQTQLGKLLLCLDMNLTTAALFAHLNGTEEQQTRGAERFERIIAGLKLTGAGQRYLREIYRESEVSKVLAGLEAQIGKAGPAAGSAQEQRAHLEKAIAAVHRTLDEAGGDGPPGEPSVSPREVSAFNVFNAVWGMLDKGRKAVFGVLEHFSETITQVHEVLDVQATLAVFSVSTEYALDPQRAAPVVELGEHGLPEVTGAAFRAVPVQQSATLEVLDMRYQVYEFEEVPNAAGRITGSELFQAAQKWLPGLNLVLQGIAVKNWKETPVNVSAGVAGAVMDVISVGLERRVAQTAQVQGSRLAMRAGLSKAARLLIGFARAGVALEIVVGTWSVGQEVAQGDMDGALAQGVMAAGGFAISMGGVAAAQTAAAGATVAVAGLTTLWWCGIGIAIFILGGILVYAWDNNDLELWTQGGFWGRRYSNAAYIQHAQTLVGDNALEVGNAPGLVQALREQMNVLYELLYAFRVRTKPRAVVYGNAVIDLDASDDVPMTLVRVERTMRFPLPSSARLSYPDVTVKIGDEALARLGEAEQQRIGIQSSVRQKLLSAERPEGKDFEPATAEQLVLRLYDSDYAAELVRREGDYRGYAVGQLVPGLDELATSSPATVTVTLTLSAGDGAFSIRKRVPLID